MKKFLFLALYGAILSHSLQAQQAWSLRQCTEHAVAHNISIHQKANVERQRITQLSTALNSRLPNATFSASESLNFGRAQTIDGTYSNRNTNNTSFSLGTSVPLFTGFQIPNTIKLNQLNLDAATQDLEKARNDIRMQVAKTYVEILYNMEMADVAHRQVSIDSAQVHRLQTRFDNGKASQAELSQQKATMAKSQLTATEAENTLQLSLLTLSQLLELPTPDGFTILRPSVDRIDQMEQPVAPDLIYQEAIAFKPEVQAERLRLDAASRQIKIQQAGFYPTLNFNAGLQTNYFKTNGISSAAFFSQLKNNFAQYVGVSLNYTIFNRLATRNNVRLARIDYENQRLTLENTKKTLYKEIQQAYYSAVAAHSKYHSSQAAAHSSQTAFELMQAKYENGKANITEFDEAKNKYLNAESEFMKARYEYLYHTALIKFYQGRVLEF